MPALLWRFLGAGTPTRPLHDDRGHRRHRHKAAAPPAEGGHSASGEQVPAHQAPAEQEPASTSSSPASTPGGALGVAAVLSGVRHWGFLLKAVSVHGADLAARLAGNAAAPLHARWQRELAGTAAVREACRVLGVENLGDLQDLLNSIILSEHVYKIVDHNTEDSVGMINAAKAGFPPPLVTLQSVQWAKPHVRHRFLLGESRDAVYVAFMGTKLPRDMATNANLFQEEVVLDAVMLASGASADIEAEAGASAGAAGGRTLAAHRGFLARARSIPIHQLYAEARARGKRLVLCGHSLGGAVASLCAIQLLQHLPPSLHHTVSVYGFATPSLGNDALAATMAEYGWDRRIRNYLNPDDPIPKLLSFRRPAQAAEGAAQAAESPAAAPAPPAAAYAGSSSSSVAADRGPRPAAVAQAAMLAAAAAAAAVTGTAAADTVSVNNIQAAPRLVAGAQQRLHRIASHVNASSAAAEQQLAGSRAGSMPRSSSAPALLADTGASSGADATAATSAAVAAAVLGKEQDAPGMGAAAAAAAAAEADSSDKLTRHGWLGRPLRRAGSAALAAAAPPMRAVVERAGSAARLVALPLSAAASVPMRAAPQYLPLGRQLYVLPGAVTDKKPAGGSGAGGWPAAPAALPVHLSSAAAVAAAVAPPARRPWPGFWGSQAAAAAAAEEGTSSHDEVEDNVDVAAVESLADPAGMAAAVDGPGADADGARRRRRGVFESHRMATYRHRLLAICQGALEGHLMLRSLPMLPSLPRPGDVAATELVAPPMFPLRAVATLEHPLAAAPTAASGTAAGAAAAGPASPHRTTAAKLAAAAGGGGAQQQPEARQPGFWQRLLARAAQQRREEPVELLIRVDGRGLENVTHAWLEGVSAAVPSPAAATAAHPGAHAAGSAGAAAASKPGSTSGGGTSSGARSSSATATMAEVSIVQQPQAQLLQQPSERPPLAVVGHLSAFVSWLAVTLGWVTLLRQLQPAGRSDYLLARVRLPASAVRAAQRAAQNSLLTSVTDGPSLLQGLRLGPRLSLRLQSDFAVHTLPLDIRVAAQVPHRPGWQWPWRRQLPALPQRQQPEERERGNRWWEWPDAGTPAGHP